MERSAEQENNYRQRMKLKAQTIARRHQKYEDHKNGKGRGMGMSSAAMKVLQEVDRAAKQIDRADKKLASMGILLLLMVWPACGQGYYVIEDTNQLRLIPSSVKVTYRTNLFEGETVTFVVTNWGSVDDPKKLTLPNGTLAIMQKQEGRLMTNVEHRITFEGQTRIWKTTQTFSQPLDTRELIVAAPPEQPFLAVPTPLRQQR